MKTLRTTKPPSANAGIRTLLPEGAFIALFASIASYLGLSSLYLPANSSEFVQQSLVLFCFGLITAACWFCRHLRWANVFRCLIIFGAISFLYNAMAHLAFNNVPWVSDGLLYSFDVQLGLDIVHTKIAPAITDVRWKTEVLSIAYSAFIPYLCVSILLHGTRQDKRLRELFLLSVALLYVIGFLGYLFVPAQGPIVYLAEQVVAPINGGFFHSLVTNAVDQAGGPHGAFPSIHVGGAVLMCLFDFRHGNRARAKLYIPVVVLLTMATVLLRYHYVVDLLAGFTIAVVALWLAEKWAAKRFPRDLVNSLQPSMQLASSSLPGASDSLCQNNNN